MWEYVKNLNQVIRKFKLKFPQGNENEIMNFIKSHLQSRFDNEGKDLNSFIFRYYGGERTISRVTSFSRYLQEVNGNYGWYFDKNGFGLHLPCVSFYFYD